TGAQSDRYSGSPYPSGSSSQYQHDDRDTFVDDSKLLNGTVERKRKIPGSKDSNGTSIRKKTKPGSNRNSPSLKSAPNHTKIPAKLLDGSPKRKPSASRSNSSSQRKASSFGSTSSSLLSMPPPPLDNNSNFIDVDGSEDLEEFFQDFSEMNQTKSVV
ncbi:hypothetical protein H4R33_001280, partial [Dimargaris cristalligena]